MPSFTTIDQKVSLPVINGFVAVPDIASNKRLTLASALTVPGSYQETIAGRIYLSFPEFDRETGYPQDWYAALRALAV